MTTRIISIALLGAATLGFSACNSKSEGGSSDGGTFKPLNGFEYKIAKDVEGKTPEVGEIVEFHLIAKVDTMVLNDTWKQGRPGAMRVDSFVASGQWQAVLPFMSEGDSAVLNVSCDSILKTIPEDQLSRTPEWLKPGNKIVLNLSVVSIQSEEEYNKKMQALQEEEMKKMEEQKAQQAPIDDQILQDYFAKNNIHPQKTASGLYYTIQKAGSGAQIQKGQTVSMMYTGKLLDGTIFDSNVDPEILAKRGGKSEPLVFPVGMGQMIPGMDEGAMLLKKGAKATLYIPSPLAYGPNSPNPNIPANAVMMFDVEITNVEASPNK